MTTIQQGRRYVGTMTATLAGERFTRDVAFTAARDQEPEPFIRGAVSAPDQDRVFVKSGPFGSAPSLFVVGSIRLADDEPSASVCPLHGAGCEAWS